MPLWADALAPRPPRPPSELLLGVIDAARTRKCSARRLGGLAKVPTQGMMRPFARLVIAAALRLPPRASGSLATSVCPPLP